LILRHLTISAKSISLVCALCAISLSCSDNSASADKNHLPNAPTSLTGHAISSSAIILYWVDNADNETSFIVFRFNSGDDWVQIATAGENQVSHTDSLLRDSSSYSYYVVAANSYGNSAPSNMATITTLAAGSFPQAPSDPFPPDDTTITGTSLMLHWNCSDPDGDTLLYDIYFGVDAYLAIIDSNIKVDSYPLDSLELGRSYNWKVVAKDGHRHVVSGPVWRFTTIANLPPQTPHDPSPADSAIGIPLDVVLSWSCSDPDDDSISFDLYFGENVDPPLVAGDLRESRFDPDSLQFSAPYYWRVTAEDQHANRTIGPVWMFDTEEQTYTLDTSTVGQGTIEIDPGPGPYLYGDTVTLTATPAPQWRFVSWTGDTVSSENPLVLVVEGDMSITAVFTESQDYAIINGNVTWPGHILSSHTYAFADTTSPQQLCIVAWAYVDSPSGNYTIQLDSLADTLNLRFEALDDADNSGWNPLTPGDGRGFYDQNGDSLWTPADEVPVYPGAVIANINIVLNEQTSKSR